MEAVYSVGRPRIILPLWVGLVAGAWGANVLVGQVSFPWMNALVFLVGLLTFSFLTPNHRRNVVITDGKITGPGSRWGWPEPIRVSLELIDLENSRLDPYAWGPKYIAFTDGGRIYFEPLYLGRRQFREMTEHLRCLANENTRRFTS